MIKIDPRGLSVREWCDRMVPNLASQVAPMKLDREEDWREWAIHVVQLLSRDLRGATLPDPYQFTDWREWARRFNQVSFGEF